MNTPEDSGRHVTGQHLSALDSSPLNVYCQLIDKIFGHHIIGCSYRLRNIDIKYKFDCYRNFFCLFHLRLPDIVV